MNIAYVNWNKQKFPTFIDNCERLMKGQAYEQIWSFDDSDIAIGDRVFVNATGNEYKKGFVASGFVKDVIAEEADGKCKIIISIDSAVDFKKGRVLEKEKLDQIFGDSTWISRGPGFNGHLIDYQYAEKIEKCWSNVVDYEKNFINVVRSAKPIDPDEHDGSYQLVREAIDAYARLKEQDENLSQLTINDFDFLWYLSTINAKKDNHLTRLQSTCLSDDQKNHLADVIDEVWQTTTSGGYLNHVSDHQVGMFSRGGSGALKGFADINSPKKMLDILIDICADQESANATPSNYNGNLYTKIINDMPEKVNSFSLGRFSQLAHCLKPNIFPIVNNNPGVRKMYGLFNITIDESSLKNYGIICQSFQKFIRDNKLNFNNYRVPDYLAYEELGVKEIDFLGAIKFLEDTRNKSYAKPETEQDANKKKEYEKIRQLGKEACHILNDKIGDICSSKFGLTVDGEAVWQHSGNLMPYLWLQLSYPNLKNKGETISVKCQQNNSDPVNPIYGFSFELEMNNDMAKKDPEIWKRHHTFLYQPINKEDDLEYIPGASEIDNVKAILESWDASSSKLKHSDFEKKKIKIGHLINKDGTNTNKDFYDAMMRSIEALIPYYEYVMSINTNSSAAFQGGQTMNISTTIKDILQKCIEDDKKQIVLTGAPGTGKTFNAKEFTGMGDNVEFVQFHPSYDYSDFVEGLRPATFAAGGTPSFVRIDGAFKKFCRKVVEENYKQKYNSELKNIAGQDDEEKYSKFIDEYTALENDDSLELKKYYFIIDEINRADLSKVFGELMYCLEDIYRGLKDNGGHSNLIQTQYNNLKTYIVNKGIATVIPFDCFSGGFFIPKNIYIIGTMNDIDRSVEAFDFALRRRFEWIEVKANDVLLDGLKGMLSSKISDTEIQDLAAKIIAMNNVISQEDNQFILTEAFHIGHAFFKKYDGTPESLEKIFNNNIVPLLKEYTRGRRPKDVEDNLIVPCANALGVNR